MSLSIACTQLLQLSSIKGLGLKTFHHLFRELGDIESIIGAEFSILRGLGIRKDICTSICTMNDASSNANQQEFERIQKWTEIEDQFVLCLEDAAYPHKLSEIYCPPPILYIKGRLDIFQRPSIAMIGSRNPSVGGQQHAFDFAKKLSEEGFCINSGLAIGIDSASHKGALQSVGGTCAVLGTGLDVIYPKQHSGLAKQICEQGVLVSEMSLGTLPLPANFPRRNRIISGLSEAVLVVEASLKSGSLITASYAIEQNRDVYAIPGSIDNPVSAGCHSLIKQGAQLVESVDDILKDDLHLRMPITSDHSAVSLNIEQSTDHDDIQIRVESGGGEKNPEHLIESGSSDNSHDDLSYLSDDERLVMRFMGYQCIPFDLLVHHTGLEVNALTYLLVGLELKGVLCSVPGGYQRLKAVNSPA